MTIAVIVYPGTNCEHDIVHALSLAGADTEMVWHRDTDLTGASGIVLPGGFAHGDYLRTGAIARFSPIMDAVVKLAGQGVRRSVSAMDFRFSPKPGYFPVAS